VSFPCFQKRSPKTRNRFWAREVRSPANFVNYLPPPPPIGTRLHSRLLIPPCRFSRCSGKGAKLAHAAASRNFCLGFFSLQTRACQHTRCIEKIPFPSRRAPCLPLPALQSQQYPPLRPPTAPLYDLRRCAWGRLRPTTPGVTLLVLVCGASEIKKYFRRTTFPPPPPS
jgi:hypothetical protein